MVRTYLVEPQTVFAAYLAEALGRAGLEVVASSAEVDPKAIAAMRPAAVFVDVDYFERGGATAICRIRELLGGATVVAYSSSEDATHRAACYISGATLVCSKSASEEELLATIRATLDEGAELRENSDLGA